jgi:hypothetical protein
LSGTHAATVTTAVLVVGLGLGVFTPANNATVMARMPASAAALTGGLVSAMRAAGTALGTVLVATTVSGGDVVTAVVAMLALTGAAVLTVRA